jgi:hypothetical protein
MQYFRPLDRRGLNVFESPKEAGVEYTSFKLDWGAAFTSQVQSLSHSNTALPNVVGGVNTNEPADIGFGFNNSTRTRAGSPRHLRCDRAIVAAPTFCRDRADDAARVAGRKHALGNISRDHAAGANDRPRADRDTRENHRAATHPPTRPSRLLLACPILRGVADPG